MLTESLDKTDNDIIEAVRSGYHAPAEIGVICSISHSTLARRLARLIDMGHLHRISPRGNVYPGKSNNKESPGAAAATPNGNPVEPAAPVAPVEHEKGHVALPPYMLNRKPVTLFISRDEEEISAVVRLELCIENRWIPSQLYGDLRLCIGESRPRWSANMEFFEGVSAYRVTLTTGATHTYPHNPNSPFTIDRKE